jgi:hypothetical protein
MQLLREASIIYRSAVHGQYDIAGPDEIAQADSVIAHSFGTSTDPNSVNGHLGLLAAFWANATQTPLIADHVLVEALPDHAPEPVATTEGEISRTLGGGLGTWGTFLVAQGYMAEHHLARPIIVAQAHHVGRTAMQAVKLGMRPILPTQLPKQFDPESLQPHTRSRQAWIPRELAGALFLKAQGRL